MRRRSPRWPARRRSLRSCPRRARCAPASASRRRREGGFGSSAERGKFLSMNPFTVVVPCSTSNLGAGFDAVGIALSGPDLVVRVVPGGEGLRIVKLSGDGVDRLPLDSSNRVIQAAHRAAASAGRKPEELSAARSIHRAIPLGRGRAAAASAALAAALVAHALLSGAVGEERILATAVAMEGHPDNVV